jgi:hypothetical protein
MPDFIRLSVSTIPSTWKPSHRGVELDAKDIERSHANPTFWAPGP